ncbi:hypothetical protein GRI42_02260 [Erythrobacter gaetbuli]|uniref:DUF3899 domain-containing protein n=1 Tax=Qipengyuania gaetbuli TaxID=266952 RepID=A0A844XX24_9SPHN|nr:hypothetical protein [Qipengyuania gaetbuli]MXO50126.1 hypothetical protein [Qipengyuania gaetbuli]
MRGKVEHTDKEARAWALERIFGRLKMLLAWIALLVSAPLTLFLGAKGIAAALNGIRDWWHYVEPTPDPDAWIYLGLFFGAGFVWLLSYHYVDASAVSEDKRFNDFIRRRRNANEAFERAAERERLREKTLWDKVKAVFVIIYGSAMLLMLVALLLKSLLA